MTDRELLEQLLKDQRDIRQNMATKADVKRMEDRLDGIEGRFDDVEERLDTLAQSQAHIKTVVEALAAG